MSRSKDTPKDKTHTIKKSRRPADEIALDEEGRPRGIMGPYECRPEVIHQLPWIRQRRLTWAEWCALRQEEGDTTVSVDEWMDSFHLTPDEQVMAEAMSDSIEQGDLRELDEYFFVRRLGNRPRVCWVEDDGLIGQMTVPDFKTAYIDKKIEVRDADGEPKLIPLAEAWLHHPKTPRFSRVKFLPGRRRWEMDADVYNMWTGWPAGLPRERDLKPVVLGDVVPDDDRYDGEDDPAECSLFLEHLLVNVCSEDELVYLYLLGWMAHALIHPGLCEAAVVMHGPTGSGKGTVAELFGSFFGPHYQPVNSQNNLTGKFNRHLMACQLVFADEVEFKDGGQASKTLSNLVTEPTLQIEFKGIDTVKMKKWFRIMLASNDDHIISVLEDDRRYLVLRVDAKKHNRDRAYFSAMRRQWADGGQVALFRWLTGRWWTEQLRCGAWDVGQRPVTDALQAQKVMSLSDGDQFLLGMLERVESGL